MDNEWNLADDNVRDFSVRTPMSVDLTVNVSVITGIIGLACPAIIFWSHFLKVEAQLVTVFVISIWLFVTIMSPGFALISLRERERSPHPLWVQRRAIGALVSIALSWAVTCSFIIFLVNYISQMDL